MKTLTGNLFRKLLLTLIAIVVLSCSKKDSEEPKVMGTLKLNVGISVTEPNANSHLKSGSAIEDFSVKVFSSKNELLRTYPRASEMPESLELSEGEYYATASSENNQTAAFDNPFYQGNSGSFTIIKGQTTSATINCKLSNIKVTVVFSSKVATSFSDYSAKVSNSAGSLVFIKNETRAGYFNSGPLQIEATLSYVIAGITKTRTLNGSITNAQVGRHYEINVDASQTEGSSIIDVVLDESVQTEIVNLSETPPVIEGIQPGDLLITEIMYHPSTLGDPAGEWIEVYNNSSKAINLKDLVLRRESTTTIHKISSDVNLTPGAYAVLARSTNSTDNVNYAYGTGLSLTNSGDELILNTFGTTGRDGTKICSVNYRATGFPGDQIGKAIQLDPSVKDINAAMIGSNWCVSTQTYSIGDFGTPGLVNPSCR